MLNKRAAAMIATWLLAACAQAAQPASASRGRDDEVIDVAFKTVSVIAFLNEVVPAGYKVSYERPDLATRTISSHGRGVWHRLLPYTGAQSGVAMRADLVNKTVYVTATEVPAAHEELKPAPAKPSAPASRQGEVPPVAQPAAAAPPQVLSTQPATTTPPIGGATAVLTSQSKAAAVSAPILSSPGSLGAKPQPSSQSALASANPGTTLASATQVVPAAPQASNPRPVVLQPPREHTAPTRIPTNDQIQRISPSTPPTATVQATAGHELASERPVLAPIAQAAAEPVVKVTAPAPQKPVWKIRKGEPIHEALVDWADKSDWTLIWYPSVSWKAIGDVVMDEQPDVVAAVSEVVTILRAEGKPIQLRVSDGNNVMEVLATEVKND